jgi:hemoglobin
MMPDGPDQHPQHVERLAAYWAEVMGGPPRYSESEFRAALRAYMQWAVDEVLVYGPPNTPVPPALAMLLDL